MPATLPNGFLIVFDGIDGVGKTTQLQAAETALEAASWPTLARRNLGGTPIGEELRQVMLRPVPRPPETDLYISVAIQAALVEQVAKDRAAGQLILMDRGPISLAAYQVYGSGLDQSLGWRHVDEGMANLKPDLTIVYTADIATSIARARHQSAKTDYFENKSLDYFERVAEGYQAAAERYDNIVTIEADGTIDAIHARTMELIKKELAKLS